MKAVNQAQWLDVNGSVMEAGALRDIDSVYFGCRIKSQCDYQLARRATDQPVDEWIIPIEHQQDLQRC